MPFARMTYTFVSCILIFSMLNAHEGILLPIFSHAIQKQYEFAPDGSESFVQEICNNTQFSSLIKESCGTLLIVKYCASNALHNDEVLQWFQALAEQHQSVRFVAIDLTRRADLALSLAQLCLTILSSSAKPDVTDMGERTLRIKKILEYVMGVVNHEYATLEPFYLFFKGDALIIPQNFSHTKPEQADGIIKTYQSARSVNNKQTVCSDQSSLPMRSKASFEDMIEHCRSMLVHQNLSKKNLVLRRVRTKKCCFI